MLTCGGDGSTRTPSHPSPAPRRARSRVRAVAASARAPRRSASRPTPRKDSSCTSVPPMRLRQPRACATKFARARERGAGDGADALVERNVDRVEQRADLGMRARRVRLARFPQPRAVHVHADAARARERGQLDELVPGRQLAADLARGQLDQQRRAGAPGTRRGRRASVGRSRAPGASRRAAARAHRRATRGARGATSRAWRTAGRASRRRGCAARSAAPSSRSA